MLTHGSNIYCYVHIKMRNIVGDKTYVGMFTVNLYQEHKHLANIPRKKITFPDHAYIYDK